MSKKVLSHEKLSETLTITECLDGFWVWDDTREMNLAMHCKTRDEAFVEAISYYQETLARVEQKHEELSTKVNSFLSQFQEQDSNDW